jgi:hypothetical protein
VTFSERLGAVLWESVDLAVPVDLLPDFFTPLPGGAFSVPFELSDFNVSEVLFFGMGLEL